MAHKVSLPNTTRVKTIVVKELTCTICGVTKTWPEFRWNPRFGVRSECKECEKTQLRCARCNQVKQIEEFGFMRRSANSKDSWCRSCRSSYANEKYHEDPKYKDAHDRHMRSNRAVAWRRQYHSRPDVKVRHKSYHTKHTNFLYHNDIIYRLKVKARGSLHQAIKSGKLSQPDTCQSPGKYGVPCSDGRIEAHHWRGYWPREAWTDVEWLCTACHNAADAQQRQLEDRIVVRDPTNPIYAAMAAKVDAACAMLGLTEMELFRASIG